MSNTRTPKSLRDRAARLQKEGGNQDLINKLLDDANAMEREGYEAGKKSGAYKAGGKVVTPPAVLVSTAKLAARCKMMKWEPQHTTSCLVGASRNRPEAPQGRKESQRHA